MIVRDKGWNKTHLVHAVNFLAQNDYWCKHKADVYEFGTYRGESLKLLENLFYANQIGIRQSYGLDSFEGLPEEAHGIEKFYLFQRGMFSDVTFYYPINGVYVKVWFNQLNESHIKQFGFQPASLVHIDSDLYTSCWHALDFMFRYNLVLPNSVVAYDEFKSTTELNNGGESRAHMEIADKYKVSFREFFRNVYKDQIECWQNAFYVESIGIQSNYGLLHES